MEEAIALDVEGVGFLIQRSTNHFEYFSATLPQVCIQHDKLGWLEAGLTSDHTWRLNEDES